VLEGTPRCGVTARALAGGTDNVHEINHAAVAPLSGTGGASAPSLPWQKLHCKFSPLWHFGF